jgi:hypothetical protein
MQDLVDAICKPPASEEGGASYEHDRVPELLGLIGRRNLRAPESSSARPETHATAQPQSSGPGHGEGSEPFGPRCDDSQLRLHRETAYPYGDPLAREAFARSPREEQASAMQARESAPESPAAACAHARPAYRADGETAVDNYPGSAVSGPPDGRPFSLQPRGPRCVDIAGVAGAVLLAALAAVGYYALSASNTTIHPTVVADNAVAAKASAADQTGDGEQLNQQPANTSWSDQPKNVRTFTIRPDVGAAERSAAELNTSATTRAHPNAHERREVGATSTSAAAFSDPQSAPSTSPASRASRNVGEQEKVRTSAAPPQVATRDAGIACQASAGSGGYWAWRMIDGRKCWYEGKPGMSKDICAGSDRAE